MSGGERVSEIVKKRVRDIEIKGEKTMSNNMRKR